MSLPETEQHGPKGFFKNSARSVYHQMSHRDTSAVKRDVEVLVEAGLIENCDIPHSGHGRKKYLKAAADRFQLLAQVG